MQCFLAKFRIETVQTRALVCLNNMLSTIEVDHLGGPEAITLLWRKIMEIAFHNDGSHSVCSFTRTDSEFVEAATSALRSVLERLAGVKTQVQYYRNFLSKLVSNFGITSSTSQQLHCLLEIP